MSRKQVRTHVADWIASEQITTLNQVFKSFPKRINFQVNAFPGQNSRAAAVVFIENESESRLAIGGAYDGWKRVDYLVALQVFHHSTQRNAEDAMDDFDNLIDTIKERLRSGGHRLDLADSDGAIIWQAAEPAIDVAYGEPVTNDGGTTETWAAIRFTVTQMIRA
jgi:hypothetical protein